MTDSNLAIIQRLKRLTDRVARIERKEPGAGYVHQWQKITANSITLTGGTSANGVADLQTAYDGLYYDLKEAAATPGQHLVVDFIAVSRFEVLRVLAAYTGTHAVAIQLYDWAGAVWHTVDSMQVAVTDIVTANGIILEEHDCTVYDSSLYVGTGANLGKVSVRCYHTPAGNASHHTLIDEVSLRY